MINIELENAKCVVCNGTLTLQTSGPGEASLYACENDSNVKYSEEWFDHYRKSEITVSRDGEILALV